MRGALATLAVLGLAAALALALGFRSARPTVTPGQLFAKHREGTVQLVGFVAEPPRFDGQLEFVLADAGRAARVRVRYGGAADTLRLGERVRVTGSFRRNVFVAERDSLIAGCAVAGGAGHC